MLKQQCHIKSLQLSWKIKNKKRNGNNPLPSFAHQPDFTSWERKLVLGDTTPKAMLLFNSDLNFIITIISIIIAIIYWNLHALAAQNSNFVLLKVI